MYELAIYTIFNNPTDYPGKMVVRKFTAIAGKVIPSAEPLCICDTLQECRAQIPQGLILTARSPEDDHAIIESWL